MQRLPVHTVVSAVLAAAFLAAPACARPSAADSEEPIKVVATTSILADLVQNVGGNRVQVRPVAPPGADVHSFQSTPRDSLAISQARLIVVNGSGLDDFLTPTIDSAAGAAAVRVVASAGLDAFTTGDPHFWQNPVNTIHYVARIRDGLIEADPANAEVYEASAAEYIRQLQELDQEIEQILTQVPPQFRHLITFHDAFGHFAARYGWRTTSLVSNDAGDVTPGTVRTVLEQVRSDGIPAVFTEPQYQSSVINRAAEDAGIRVGALYSDVLNDRAATYIDMMRFNANSLAEHLGK